MPKVSVIIPNYNHAAFLRQRVDSILSQTIQDIEVILMDDCSTDNSRAEIERYRRLDRVRIVYNVENSGNVFRQWNKGIRLATGEYVWIAESDDFADPMFLEVLIGLLDANPQAGLAYCRSWLVGDDGKAYNDSLEYTRNLDSERWRNDFVASGQEECGRYLVLKNTIPNASAVLIRRAALNSILPIDESFNLCGDWMTWARILSRFDVAYSSRPLNFYRHHGAALRARTPKVGSLREMLRARTFMLRTVEVPKPVLQKLRGETSRVALNTLRRRDIGVPFGLIPSLAAHGLHIQILLWRKLFCRKTTVLPDQSDFPSPENPPSIPLSANERPTKGAKLPV